jgi:hypothetical protein
MKSTTATWLLKAVLVISTLAILFVACWGVPRFMGHVTYVRPELWPWVLPMDAYAGLIAIPVLITIVLLWRVFDTIPRNEAFSPANAIRFQRIALLATADLVLVLALAAFLLISGVIAPFLVISLMAAVYIGVVALIVFNVLAALVRNAAEIKQDNELTI